MTYDPEVLLGEARKLLPEIVRLRRQIHERHPEKGLALPHTQGTIIEALGNLNLQITPEKQLSSVVATPEGRHPGESCCCRAIWPPSELVLRAGSRR